MSKKSVLEKLKKQIQVFGRDANSKYPSGVEEYDWSFAPIMTDGKANVGFKRAPLGSEEALGNDFSGNWYRLEDANLPLAEARGILSGSIKGDKKKAEQELNRLYSDWVVNFKTKDGSKYTMKVNGCRNENEAFNFAVKRAISNGNGDSIDKSSPLKVEYQRKW